MNEHQACTCPASKSGSFQIATDHYSRNFIPTGWKLEYASLEPVSYTHLCYSQSTVLPAKVFGLEHEGGAHHA